MSDNANAPAPAAEPLGGSFQQAVHADQQQQVREERFRIVLLGVLIVFVLGYMTWIYSSIKQFDAGELTRIAGLKVEGQIPEIKKQMRTVALDNADQVTDRLKDLLLSAPAELRRTATAEAKAHLHQAAQDLGKQLGDKLVEDFRANVDHMYAKSPNEMSPDERLDAFVTQFRKNFVKVSDALLEQHSGALQFGTRQAAQAARTLPHRPAAAAGG